jgi:hypothetical protein
MATFEDLVQEVLLNLEGFTGDEDLFGTLNTKTSVGDTNPSPLSATASQFSVDGSIYPDGSGFTAGVIELGDELIYAQAFDRTIGLFSGCLRGWRGTTAVEHPHASLIRNNPNFPRTAVKRAINDAIRNLHPRVPAIKTYEFTYQGAQVRYDMPEGCRQVIQVSWLPPGPTKAWLPVKRWNFDLTGGSNSVTGRAIDVFEGMPGRKVQVVYYSEATALAASNDDFKTVTGLEDWVRDLVVLGACYRLASFLDAGRVSTNSASQVMLNQQQPVGSGTNLSKYFYSLYQQRLAETEARIQDLYPVARHFIA